MVVLIWKDQRLLSYSSHAGLAGDDRRNLALRVVSSEAPLLMKLAGLRAVPTRGPRYEAISKKYQRFLTSLKLPWMFRGTFRPAEKMLKDRVLKCACVLISMKTLFNRSKIHYRTALGRVPHPELVTQGITRTLSPAKIVRVTKNSFSKLGLNPMTLESHKYIYPQGAHTTRFP